jgi:hypothetical protein
MVYYRRIIARIDQHNELSQLPIAEGASFDSHVNEHDPRCHEDTRTNLLNEITRWAHDPHGKGIFWLKGMAGTGKSTISRTIAMNFANSNELGASFFFKRGEKDRGNAARFFTTIVHQLVQKIPEMIPEVCKVINANPGISQKWIKEQFEKLISQPLSVMPCNTAQPPVRVIVIDALDECERDNDIKLILHLLSQIPKLYSVRMRVFLTSRPELPIRLGFEDMADDEHEDLVLHEISKEIIDHDLFVFLKDKLEKIRSHSSLPAGWPGDEKIHFLVDMASPLFIFAATICLFLEDKRLGDTKKKMQSILEFRDSDHASQLERTYLPVLERLEADLTARQKQTLAEQFHLIVGSIITLEEPLSTKDLARILTMPKEEIDGLLDSLHSVLDIPQNSDLPVRLLHLSFRDFLVDPSQSSTTIFAVNEKIIHETLAIKCLELIDSSKSLRRDLCDLYDEGTLRSNISEEHIQSCISPALRYACRYWIDHLRQSGKALQHEQHVFAFLKTHLLHWLEVMSLLERMTEAIAMVLSLQSMLNVG